MLSGNGNDLQVAPVLTSALSSSASTVVLGTLTAAPNATYQVQLFANPAADPSGFGQGQTYLVTKPVTTNGSGVASLTFTIKPALAAGEVVSATATSPSNNTSAFSNDVTVTGVATTAAVPKIVPSAPPASAAPDSVLSVVLGPSSTRDDSALTDLAVDRVHTKKHHAAVRLSHKPEPAGKVTIKIRISHPQLVKFQRSIHMVSGSGATRGAKRPFVFPGRLGWPEKTLVVTSAGFCCSWIRLARLRYTGHARNSRRVSTARGLR
jgi:hypothetical protein